MSQTHGASDGRAAAASAASAGGLTGMPCDLSVVIATHNASAVVGAALAALVGQPGADRTEIIVADSSTDGTPAIVRTFPRVRLLHYDQPLTVPALRGKGIAAASGSIIAILDPFAMVAPDWIRQVIAAHAGGAHPVIGGAVDLHDPAGQTLFGWALYINEYGLFMPPISTGATDIVPGCNVWYTRAMLFDADRPRFEVFWKTFVNLEIQAAGSPLWLAPGIVVALSKPVPFTAFLVSRFDHGRCYAAMRPVDGGWSERWLRAGTTPLLPLIMSWRWGRRYWAKRRHRRKLVATLPLQLLLFGMWAAGEGVGYIRGPGGSCRRLFY